jgi:hypothetical protein
MQKPPSQRTLVTLRLRLENPSKQDRIPAHLRELLRPCNAGVCCLPDGV